MANWTVTIYVYANSVGFYGTLAGPWYNEGNIPKSWVLANAGQSSDGVNRGGKIASITATDSSAYITPYDSKVNALADRISGQIAPTDAMDLLKKANEKFSQIVSYNKIV